MYRQETPKNVPIVSIRDNMIVTYSTSIEREYRTAPEFDREKNLTRGEYNGYLSSKSKSTIRKYLTTWLEGVKEIRKSNKRKALEKIPYITFVTLTLPSKQVHSDNYIKRHFLNHFIITAARKWNVKEYFWRAEPQKNGNIHFHLLVDSYIDWKELRQEWNGIVNKGGYIDRFAAKNGHRNPNSTDIHKLNEVRNTVGYVVKYCLKNESSRKIEGRIHGCSDNLRQLQPYNEYISTEEIILLKKVEKMESTKKIEGDCFTIYLVNMEEVKALNQGYFSENVNSYYIDAVAEIYEKKKKTIEDFLIEIEEEEEEEKEAFQLEIF